MPIYNQSKSISVYVSIADTTYTSLNVSSADTGDTPLNVSFADTT